MRSLRLFEQFSLSYCGELDAKTEFEAFSVLDKICSPTRGITAVLPQTNPILLKKKRST